MSRPDELLTIVTANLWRENPRAEHDIRLLVGQGSSSIGINEGRKYASELRTIGTRNGYTVHGEGSTNNGNNPVLLQDSFTVRDVERRVISDRVGISPARTCLGVKFEATHRYAHLNTHFNSHVQEGRADPHELPRVDEYIDGTREVTGWARWLRKHGWRVVVTGDMNWAWMARGAKAWWWSPQRAFKRRCGMICQFDKKMLPRPKGDRRPIEYVFWHPDDFAYQGQNFIKGEHSDHPFHEVALRPRPRRR